MNNATIVNDLPLILAVDDEEDLLMLLHSKLKSLGYRVQISQNATNVIDLVHETPPGIILLDIKMQGIDGGTVCRILKNNKSTSHIPIVMLSANDNLVEVSQSCGADGFISKPFTIESFNKEVERVMSKAS